MTKTKRLKHKVAGLVLLASLSVPTLVSADTYRVKSGDTLSGLAVDFQTTLDNLLSLNQLSNPNVLTVGQELTIKRDNTQSSTAVADVAQDDTATTSSTSGLSEADLAAKEWIAQKESSGSYTAQNGQYYGRYQLTLSYLNGDLSPENQERVADNYVTQRYGSWSAAKEFWLANGWY
ncbi:LysM peptidoglycan-binding domain-containing protein [Streptococcus sp. sy010]|uniref:aggregation-promoting factor n=1 Tax=Streptococcus sp. sy010 TaxID=2600148 RepID=UPI0011B4B328|nr:LysM peptidoglycan-binding domain-containing protein [Streptococcus sp. sy010]TWT14394.1 LysM peptidoglycan-binding domain-containing protein [Streptococcus sp. sy010]